MASRRWLNVGVGALLGGVVLASSGCHQPVAGESAVPAAGDLAPPPPAGPPAGDGVFPTPVYDATGRLWLSWFDDGHVYVASSDDQGVSFATATRVTAAPEDLDANGEARSKIALGPHGEVYVTWTSRGTRPFTGDIRFTRSTDGGTTFDPPRTINDDGLPIGHRFETLGVNADGDLFLVWIDKRDLERATAAGEPYAGAALYYTWSTDRGVTFAPNRKLKDHVCECCRIALAFEDGRWPVLVWREVLPGSIRDHGVVRFTGRDTWTDVGRVADDGWRLEGCPHHGPGLSLDGAGTYHTVWFTGESPTGPGAYYARSDDRGATFTDPMRVGADARVSHADVLAWGPDIHIAWQTELDPRGTGIAVMHSADAGATWGAPRVVARTARGADQPRLTTDGTTTFLSWHTEDEGYRLIPVDPPSTSD